MKTKNFVKKLVLNKKTIAHLEKDELTDVKGGTTPNSLAAGCTTLAVPCGSCLTCVNTCTCPFVCGP